MKQQCSEDESNEIVNEMGRLVRSSSAWDRSDEPMLLAVELFEKRRSVPFL
jgi:hypothetical protein